MTMLDKTHDSNRNRILIDNLLGEAISLQQISDETDELFNAVKREVVPSSSAVRKNIVEKLWSLLSIDYTINGGNDYGQHIAEGEMIPEWKEQLDQQYQEMKNRIEHVVNVKDFGAVGDGLTDCTKAFQDALGTGHVHVHVPAGVYLVKKIRLPSWTRLCGEGMGATTIRLHSKAPKRRILLSNDDFIKGNRNIAVEGLTLDWNKERLKNPKKTNTFGNASSCFVFANVKYGWAFDVEGLDPGLHCFDLTSPLYNYGGDGRRARGGSSYIWLDRVKGSGFGDDGVTTHHSEYLFVSNSHFCDPSGKAHREGFSNSNGIEVDDGSKHVWLSNNSSARCFGGVEIKAHHNSSAASGVYISGHLSVNDNRSFNFRHIGHHSEEDPESKSAFNIKAQRLVSVAPVYTNLYRNSSPRSLVISGYRNVAINRFLFIGNRDYDYRGNPVASVQYRAANIGLSNGQIKDFRSSGAAISIAGGSNNINSVLVQNISVSGQSAKAIKVGTESEQVIVKGIFQQEE
jgi:hypothetical protein